MNDNNDYIRNDKEIKIIEVKCKKNIKQKRGISNVKKSPFEKMIQNVYNNYFKKQENNQKIDNKAVIYNKNNKIKTKKTDKELNNNEIIISDIYKGESRRSIINHSSINSNIIETINNIISYNDNEINLLPYDLALQYDKRTCYQYYISLLKSRHNFIFLFSNKNDFNSKIIKLDLILIGFTTVYTIIALFYTENTIHKIYENNGSYKIGCQFDKIIYSSLISSVFDIPLKLLALSNDLLINLNLNKYDKNIKSKGKNLWKTLRIEFFIYFIITFILLLFCWYYISIFGAIYINTQYHLLKDTIISFVLKLIYPFIIYLLPIFIRFLAISDQKKNKECLYNLSKVIQTF